MKNLLSFCPNVLFAHMQNGSDGTNPTGPVKLSAVCTQLDVACILADISGFTKLSSSFCKEGMYSNVCVMCYSTYVVMCI